jgi:hypothetical protein
MALAKQMKKTVMKTTKEVVTNKYVLYVVLFIALTNVLAYLGTSNYIGLAIFSLIGLLTSYFTKNMTIILLVTIVVSSFIHISRRTVEGMKNKESKKDKVKGVEEDEINDGESAEVSDEDDEEDSNDDMPVMKKGSKINHQKTVEESYKNLHNILGNENFKEMTKDTNKLLEQQNKLTDSLNSMAPLLESAQGILKGFDMDKINSMMNTLGSVPQVNKKQMKKISE